MHRLTTRERLAAMEAGTIDDYEMTVDGFAIDNDLVVVTKSEAEFRRFKSDHSECVAHDADGSEMGFLVLAIEDDPDLPVWKAMCPEHECGIKFLRDAEGAPA